MSSASAPTPIDFVYRLPAYPRPDSAFAKLPITEHLISCGGQVATALATCAAMGLSTSYIGTIGSDAHGRRMRDELQRRGIDLSHAITRDAGNPFAVILLDDREGERVVLWQPRPAAGARRRPRSTVMRSSSARLVHVDDVDLDASIEAARLARGGGGAGDERHRADDRRRQGTHRRGYDPDLRRACAVGVDGRNRRCLARSSACGARITRCCA